jgi:hypothetical protein
LLGLQKPESTADHAMADIELVGRLGRWKQLEVSKRGIVKAVTNKGMLSIFPGRVNDSPEAENLPLNSVSKQHENRIFIYGRSSEQGYLYKGRFYIAAEHGSLTQVVKYIYDTFNHYSIPFLIKLFVDIGNRRRSDNCILYLNPASCNLAYRILSIYLLKNPDVISVRKQLNFARKLQDGLFFGESPGEGRSFGYHRSQAIASLMIRVNNQCVLKAPSPGSYDQAKDEVLASYGIDSQRMCINKNSSKDYYSFL